MCDQTAMQPLHEYQRFLHRLPQDWERKEIRQLGTVIGGGTPSRDVPSFWRGTIPWVTPGEVSGNANKYLYDTNEHISPAGLAGSGANLLPAGSLMVTTRATLGARAINAVPMATNQGFKSIIFKQPADSGFYLHLFEKVQPELARRASGTTFLEISSAEFGGIEVPSPSLGEKRLITNILDTLDTAIHETEAIIAKLKAVKQGLLHDLLTRGIDANGELRPPQAEAPHLYKQSPLGWIPKEWNTSGLANVAPRDRSVIRTGPFGSSLKGEHWRESGRPVVTIGSLGEGTFIASELLFVDEHTANRLADFELVPGDIVFSRVADVGRAVVITEDEHGWIMSSNFMRISVNKDKVRPRFLQMLLSSSLLVRKQIRATVNSGGRDVANSAVLMGLHFPWPKPEEQDHIIDRVESLDERITAEETELEKLQITKHGLMDDLLTGRVRVASLLEASPSFAQRPATQIAQEPAEQTGG